MAINISTLRKTPTGAYPPMITVYGTDGVGKTGLALQAPDVVYAPTEPRFAHYETFNMFQTETDPNAICQTFKQMCEGLEALLTQEHSFKTLVMDSLDHFEPQVWDAVVRNNPMTEGGKTVNSIEDYGFAKGYILAESGWRYFFKLLDRLRSERGMMIILVAHYSIKEEATAEGEPYDQFQIKLHKRAAALVRERSDAVLFAKFNTFTKKVGTGIKTRTQGISNGERLIICQPRPSCVVKNSFPMPVELPLEWQAIAQHIPFLNNTQSQEK